ncbi:MAG: cation:proton antiporter [Candidatus Omnitrophica bacterium]|nr:cation:proton antiporter [Candidatus Omnitrophota bacterium]
MHFLMDPSLPKLFGIALVILIVGQIFLYFKQPVLIAYLLTGIAIGPHGLQLVEDTELINWLGSIGVILLLFFMGMEFSVASLVANWRISIFGTFLQIVGSVAAVFCLGYWLHWPLVRIVLLGFVISLSSTSIILRLIKYQNTARTQIAQDVMGITLTQDLAVVPMLIILGFLKEGAVDRVLLTKQLIGTVVIAILILYILKRKEIKLPFSRLFANDEDMQLFSAFCICFGMALLTGFFGLSMAIGAFIGGLILRSTKDMGWVKSRLEPFRIFLMAVFFISIGMMIDFKFIIQYKWQLFTLTIIALMINTFINTFVLRMMGRSMKEGLQAGALLAQISEFGFVLAAVGLQFNIITEYSYDMTVALISVTLLLSPTWVAIIDFLLRNISGDV